MRISGCVIAKDEELEIKKCLESLKAICDEVILVDTGSTDRTVEIAKREGVIIDHFKWVDDFSAAKNHAKTKASGDWLIFLDADEYFLNTELLNTRLKSMLSTLPEKYEIVSCNIDNLDDNDSVFLTHVGSRIVRNKSDIWFEGKVHEDLKRSGESLNVARATDITIVHTGYKTKKIKERDKFHRNISLLEEEIRLHPEDPHLYFYLADTYEMNNDFLKVIENYKKSIVKGDIHFQGMERGERECRIAKAVAHSSLAFYIKEFEIMQLLRKYPDHFRLNFYMAMIAYDEKRYHMSQAWIVKAQGLIKGYKVIQPSRALKLEKLLYNVKARVHRKLFNFDQAVDDIITAISLEGIDNVKGSSIGFLMQLLKFEEPMVSISIINQLYKGATIESYEALIDQCVVNGMTTHLNYYIKKIYDIHQSRSSKLAYSFLYQSKYEQAMEEALRMYNFTKSIEFIYVHFSANVGKNGIGNYEKIQQFDLYKNMEIVKVEDQIAVEREVISIMLQLAYLPDKEHLYDFIDMMLVATDSRDYILKILNALYEHNLLEDVIVIAKKYMTTGPDYLLKGKIFEILGLTSLVKGDSYQAVAYFCDAIENSCINNRIFEALTVIQNSGISIGRVEMKAMIKETTSLIWLLPYIQ